MGEKERPITKYYKCIHGAKAKKAEKFQGENIQMESL